MAAPWCSDTLGTRRHQLEVTDNVHTLPASHLYSVSNMAIATQLLRPSWEAFWLRLQERCDGLTDDEYFWSPVPDAWDVHPDPDRPGRWTYEYDFAPPPPAPVTTISWRLVHLIVDQVDVRSPTSTFHTRRNWPWNCGEIAGDRSPDGWVRPLTPTWDGLWAHINGRYPFQRSG